MSRRTRRALAMLALCVAASMALGVGSYSSVSADRSVSVAVVEDSEAYLGLRALETRGCGNKGRLRVTNRFATEIEQLDVSIERVEGPVNADVVGTPSEVGIGASGVISVRVTPAGTGPPTSGVKTVVLDIAASGAGINVTTTAPFRTDCKRQPLVTGGGGGGNGEDGDEDNGEDSGEDNGEDSGEDDGEDSGEDDGEDGDEDNGEDSGEDNEGNDGQGHGNNGDGS